MFSKATATVFVSESGVPMGIVMFSVTESSLPFGIMFTRIVGIMANAITSRHSDTTTVTALLSSAARRMRR